MARSSGGWLERKSMKFFLIALMLHAFPLLAKEDISLGADSQAAAAEESLEAFQLDEDPQSQAAAVSSPAAAGIVEAYQPDARDQEDARPMPPELTVEMANGPLADLDKLVVYVLLDKGADKAGLTLAMAKADIQSRLALLTIPVTFIDKDPGLDPKEYPLLTLSVDTGIDKKWYRPDTFLVSANLKDMVLLERDLSLRAAGGLWAVSEHGYDNRVLPAIRSSLMRLTDAFMLSYAQANPHLLNPDVVNAQAEPEATEPDPLAP